MLIHKRSLIVLTAVTASVLGLVALALAIAVRLELLSAQQAQPIVLLAFTLLFPIAFIGLFLFAEVATKYEKSEPWYLFDSLIRFDVSRSSTPLLYWMILIAQTTGGVFLILHGIENG